MINTQHSLRLAALSQVDVREGRGPGTDPPQRPTVNHNQIDQYWTCQRVSNTVNNNKGQLIHSPLLFIYIFIYISIFLIPSFLAAKQYLTKTNSYKLSLSRPYRTVVRKSQLSSMALTYVLVYTFDELHVPVYSPLAPLSALS